MKCSDTGVCVRRDKVCDGCIDCLNGDDERNCTTKRCTGMIISFVNFDSLIHKNLRNKEINHPESFIGRKLV